MAPEDAVHILLKDLPKDLRRFIMSKIASSSALDLCNGRLSCKSLKFAISDKIIAKHLNLSPLVKNPKKAKSYMSLLNSCLEVGNLDAQFIFGVIQFFDCGNKYLGMHHFEVSCRGGHREGSYFFGFLTMCFGRIEEGKEMVNKLTDTEGITVVEDFWEVIQFSLSSFKLSMEDVYVNSYVTMKPELHCHLGEADTVCCKCFHVFLVAEFMEMIISLNTIVPR